MKNCKVCGCELTDGARFCNQCGAPCEEAARCAVCGAVLTAREGTCPSCGVSSTPEATQAAVGAPSAGANEARTAPDQAQDMATLYGKKLYAAEDPKFTALRESTLERGISATLNGYAFHTREFGRKDEAYRARIAREVEAAEAARKESEEQRSAEEARIAAYDQTIIAEMRREKEEAYGKRQKSRKRKYYLFTVSSGLLVAAGFAFGILDQLFFNSSDFLTDGTLIALTQTVRGLNIGLLLVALPLWFCFWTYKTGKKSDWLKKMRRATLSFAMILVLIGGTVAVTFASVFLNRDAFIEMTSTRIAEDGTFSYRQREDGKVEIVEILTDAETVEIPAILNDMPVVSVAAFAGTEKKLEKLILPNTLETIGIEAFRGCDRLKSVVFRTSGFLNVALRSIGRGAFNGCAALRSFGAGNGGMLDLTARMIEAEAFKGCGSVENIRLSDWTESVGDYAFQNCERLRSVTFGRKAPVVKETAFRGCLKLNTVKLGRADDEFFDRQKSDFRKLQAVLGSAVLQIEFIAVLDGTQVAQSAFVGCSALKTVTLPSLTERIGAYAFFNCSALTEIRISEHIKSIGNYAFANCSNARAIYSLGYVPPTLGTHVFTNTSCPIYVPSSALGKYRSSWQSYAGRLRSS